MSKLKKNFFSCEVFRPTGQYIQKKYVSSCTKGMALRLNILLKPRLWIDMNNNKNLHQGPSNYKFRTYL